MVTKIYDDILRQAVEDVAEHGFDNAERISYWAERIRQTAEQSTRSAAQLDQMVREGLVALYTRLVERGVVIKDHPGVKRFTLDMVRPAMRPVLDRRILAATDLIRLNKTQAVELTLKRFAGWATSIPKGGSAAVKQRKVVADLKKPLQRQSFEVRRLLTDQGHKLRASISQTVAEQGSAIAGIWHSHWRQPNYNYRPDHKERDLRVYAVRGCWALDQGLMKAGPDGYYDQITAAAEEPFCRCYMEWRYSLSALPPDMLTEKGRAALEEARRKIAA
jgi:hypothetical protein